MNITVKHEQVHVILILKICGKLQMSYWHPGATAVLIDYMMEQHNSML